MVAKLRLVFTITIAFLSFYGYAQNDYWQQKSSQRGIDTDFATKFDVKKGKQFAFNERLFKKELSAVSVDKRNSKIVYFPNEEGVLVAFQVVETPVMSPELSAKYPQIKSYSGYAVGNRKSKIRFSVSHKGIQSMMVNPDQKGTTFMQKNADDTYVLYTRDPNAQRNKDFICATYSNVGKSLEGQTQKVEDQLLRKFRLAVTASGEYTQYHGGTVPDALAAINATVTRINEVFETDLAVTLELIPGLEQVIFTDPLNDPYSGNLSPKVQTTLDNTLGATSYDVGILFNQANQSDGNAGFIGAVCVDGRKGSAYATGDIPEGDLYDVDFVAHEIGHQFGANHTWSFEPEGTQVQMEPASGTTIMGYAGITGINNVAPNGDDYFHYASIVQITDYLQTVSCFQTISLTNEPPVVTPTGNFTIPKSTAFVLTAVAVDANVDDVLTYSWEQIDNGIVPQSSFGPTNPQGANFRSQKPSTSPERYFPKLSQILQGNLTQTAPSISSAWETVSDVEREMNFALTVRDNAIGGGQVASDLVNVFVENNAGPFVITSQNSNAVATAGSVESIEWDVANTNMPPINAQTVDILLSTDGGDTFPIMLAENVPNDGNHNIVIPGNPTTEGRIMVRANDNIFFAVNSSDFTIDSSEIVLNFSELEHEVCQNDVLVVPFNYEAYEGFSEEATFSVILPPVGVDIAFFPETATSTDTPVDITFTNTQNLAVGSYPIRVLATTATMAKEVTFDLNVYDAGFTELTLVAPADGLIDSPTIILLEWEEEFLATSYNLEIATDAGFTNITETVTVIGASYAPLNLANQTQYFWRVRPENNCGVGSFGTPFNFTTIQFSCMDKTGDNLSATISSSGTPTVISEIAIFDDLPVADINVSLELDHTYLGDLTVTLTSPLGTSVVLFNNSCDDLRNVNATFDDNALAFVCNGDPAIEGTVKPLGNLSSFNGESTLGIWKLTIADNAPADGGRFKSFSLEICAEGEFRPDADNDGVFDDGPDLCLGTPEGTEVDSFGCPVLIFPPSNFTVEIQGESCRNNNDGAIVVGVKLPVDYAITVMGNGTSLTDTFVTSEYVVNNLAAGTYDMCITATDAGLEYRQQCFVIEVTEPELLSVASKTSLTGKVVDLQMEGASLYNIELNGVVTQTEDAQFSVNLKEGFNTLKVTTNLACQGTYEEQFFFSASPVVYPNPFSDWVNVSFSASVEEVNVEIFSAIGQFIKRKRYKVTGSELELDLRALASGLYFIKFEGDNIKGTSKVMKK